MTDLRKSVEAFLRGYVLFDVNGERFYLYSSARSRRLEITGSLEFNGWHIFKGWRCFFKRIGCSGQAKKHKEQA